jgi:hypothetical protein
MRARQAKKIATRVLDRAFEVIVRDGGFIPGVNTGEAVAPWRHRTMARYIRKLARLVHREARSKLQALAARLPRGRNTP